MRLLLSLVLIHLRMVTAIFFGGGDCGCNSCCAPAPAPCAPPQPVCQAPAPCLPPPPPQFCGCESGGYKQPQKFCPPQYIYSNGNYGTAPLGGNYYSTANIGNPLNGPVVDAAVVSFNAEETLNQPSKQQAKPTESLADSDNKEAAGAAVSVTSTTTEITTTTTTDHPTYSVNAREYGAKTFNSTSRCPNSELLQFIDDSIVENDAINSKRKVYKTLNSVFSSEDEKLIDVFCAKSRLSYRITADIFCERTKGSITCVAYKQA